MKQAMTGAGVGLNRSDVRGQKTWAFSKGPRFCR